MIINVRVKPNSYQQEVIKDGENYIVSLKSVPKDGKANIELLKLLKKYFKKEARIKSGKTSKNKRIELI